MIRFLQNQKQENNLKNKDFCYSGKICLTYVEKILKTSIKADLDDIKANSKTLAHKTAEAAR